MSSAIPRSTRSPERVWYEEGLRFTCTRCCRCCTGPPGYVWVTEEEQAEIAALLGLGVREFSRRYCRIVGERVSLRERANGDCVLLTPAGCSAYPVRPGQCRAFPFWPDNLRSPRCWEVVGERCPGVGRGRLYSRQEIERILAGRSAT
jgi:hypothetical protein